MRSWLCMLLLAATPAMAQAQERPPEIPTSIHAPAPVGKASLHKLVFHVYDISFWSDSGGWAHAPYALSITYAMDFTKDDLVERTMKELRQGSSLSKETIAGFGKKLAAIWPDITEGDRITALAKSEDRTVFFHNGREIGEVKAKGFTMAFFAIWLGPHTSEPAIRKKLLKL